MTKLVVKGNISGTGVVTLRPQSTEEEVEIEIPAGAGKLARADAAGMPLMDDGTPVVESGSNSDGEWWRSADGQQWCGVEQSATFPVGSSQWSWTYPVSFIARPRAFIQYFGDNTGVIYAGLEGCTSESAMGFVHNDHTGSVNSSLLIDATGRWK